MRSWNRWVYDWEFDSDEFIDLGLPTREKSAVKARRWLATTAGLSRLPGTQFNRVYRLQARNVQWTALAALVPVACTGLHTAVAQSEAPPLDTSVLNSNLSDDEGTSWYVGGGIGLASLQPDSYCECLTLSEDSDVTFNLYAGLDISERYAVEFQYGKLGAPQVDFLGESVGSIDYQVAGLSGLLYLFNSQHTNTEREGLSAFLKAGAGIMRNDSSLPYHQKHESQFWLGAGAEYGFNDGWAVRAEVNSYDTDARQVAASVLKRFGQSSGGMVKTAAVPVPTPTQSEPVARLQIPEPPQDSMLAVELPTVFFAFDHDGLNAGAREKLDELVSVMETAPRMKLRLEGHADAVGSVNYNDKLSINRAESVRDYLVSKSIPSDRIELLGYGELKPAADNSTDAGRARNRRVEVHLLSA